MNARHDLPRMRTITGSTTSGADIQLVQWFLIGEGYWELSGSGHYTPAFKNAVARWQADYGLNSSPPGVVDIPTYCRMIEHGLPVIHDVEQELPVEPDLGKRLTNNEQRFRHWGRFKYDQAFGTGLIQIQDPWVNENIVPCTGTVGGFVRHLCLHKRVIKDFEGFMRDVKKQDLEHLILQMDEGFEPRLMRGHDTTLSAHAFGIAFTINESFNRLGHTPAFIGQQGSVRELVEIAANHGWHWGGWNRRREGGHFEHV